VVAYLPARGGWMRRREFIAALGSATRGRWWRARSRLAMPVIVEELDQTIQPQSKKSLSSRKPKE
jgi:hypothetical protein